MSYFVFEMDLDMKRSPGVIETKTKVTPLCVLVSVCIAGAFNFL
jgi:hypothetical protein